MKTRIICLIAAAAFTLSSCIYPYEAQIDETESRLVVEADILAGGTTSVYISRLVSFPELSSDSFTRPEVGEFDVKIEVEGGATLSGVHYEPLWKDTFFGTEQYRVDCSQIKAGQRCRLRLLETAGSKEYESDWITVLDSPRIDSLSYFKNLESGILEMRVSFHNDEDNRYYLLTADEVWEYHAWQKANWVYDSAGDSIKYVQIPDNYYCWRYFDRSSSRTIDLSANTEARLVNYVYQRVIRSDQRLQIIYKSAVNVKTIPKDSYEYWANIGRLSSVSGDLFTPNPSDRPGNIHCITNRDERVIGIVTASAFTRDSIYFFNDQEQFYRDENRSRNIQDYTDTLSSSVFQYDLEKYRPGWKLFAPSPDENSYNPYGETWLEKYKYWVFIHRDCVDCRDSMGGTTLKPDYWPNDHPGRSASEATNP